MIKLHNDLMSVKQKLIDCEKSIKFESVDSIEKTLDSKIKTTLDSIITCYNTETAKPPFNLLTPTVSSNGIASSKESSIESKSGAEKDDNNNYPSSFSSSKQTGNSYNFQSFILR
jgi:hypothetical protein